MLKLEECFFCRGLNSIKFVLVKFRDSLFALNQFGSLSSSQFKVLIRKSGSVCEINKFVSSLCRRSPRQEQPPGKSPWQSSNPLPFYPTYREYRSLFAASENNKAFAPSSNAKRHLGHIWCDLRTPSIKVNRMAWFTGFPVNVVKSTSRKQGDLCMRESRVRRGAPPFLSTPTRLAIIRFGTR